MPSEANGDFGVSEWCGARRGRAVFWLGGVWDLFGVFRGDIWALTEQGPPKFVGMSRFCWYCAVFYLKQRVVLLR
jgi:hypothetical protein